MTLDNPHLSALLAALALKVCPKCGSLGFIRTSESKGDSRLYYLRCRCGHRWKRMGVVPSQASHLRVTQPRGE
jgi:hypothetical protein